MNIAHISYEYPPDTSGGGISTYVDQITRVLSLRGHTIHVFCGSKDRNTDEDFGNIHIHRIKTPDVQKFKWEVVKKFSEIHEKVPFDIMESPEFNADGLILKKTFPELPLIVRLHTPHFLLRKISSYKIPLLIKGYRLLVFWYLQLKKLFNTPQFFFDEEREICNYADEIHSPSISLSEICMKKWGLETNKVKVIPYVFSPSKELLEIPINSDPKQRIYYLGGLATRKGLYAFEKIIPEILERYPHAEFHFIGKPQMTFYRIPFDKYLLRKCSKWSKKMFFRQVKYDQIPDELRKADICIFPSIWENFPNVCLEAMSAGRAIIASKNGGMKDMLEDRNAGILVDPKDWKSIAKKIVELFTTPGLIYNYGEKARSAVLEKYNAEKIGDLVEREFEKIIQ